MVALSKIAADRYSGKRKQKGLSVMKVSRLFREHPASVGESYGEHLRHACAFGFRMIVGGCACVVHGLLPFLFVRTGSRQIRTLHDRMVVDRHQPLPGILDFVI